MKIKDHTFQKDVFKELDLVWKTYLNTGRGIKQKGVRRPRQPKLIHIYGGDEFFKAVEKTLDSNPLMRIILDTIDKPEYRYYPIYTRKNKGYRVTREPDMYELGTYYDIVNHVWDYEDHQVDFAIDEVVGGYPPILTWLFIERPSNSLHGDLLIYLIKKRYASKENGASEATNGGTETESDGSSKKHSKNTMTFDSWADLSNATESNIDE